MSILYEGIRAATMRGEQSRALPALTLPGFQPAGPAQAQPHGAQHSPSFRFVDRLRGLSGRYEIARQPQSPEDLLDAAPEDEAGLAFSAESSGMDLHRMLYNRHTAWALVSEIDEDEPEGPAPSSFLDEPVGHGVAPFRRPLAEQLGVPSEAVPT
eukprot:CAMPEP_0206260432 /NCGR_PEP_ID=MMETSP0047_2-20121206/27092_1 /ASSEMBLY_ACC=CAM_ASM_000192 /TAXON_ID=195065 /ORGANISM="Chroomonas mesostigmatica_cf, Strain CCMP1168" /LENGTH=154 /DNA_ID=CAMNT_0053687527 /DNA_START=24 /DNA_END=484 /DNA_ORIENTATION=-